MFTTATIRKLTDSFVVSLAAARFSGPGKRDRKGGVVHTKVGVVDEKIEEPPLLNILHPPLQMQANNDRQSHSAV